MRSVVFLHPEDYEKILRVPGAEKILGVVRISCLIGPGKALVVDADLFQETLGITDFSLEKEKP